MARKPSKKKTASAPTPLAAWLAAAAKAHPGLMALEAPQGVFTYAELHAAVRALAAQLSAAGIGKGDRVAIAATRSADTIIAILAAVESGAGYVPLDTGYPAERLQAMLEGSQPRVVLGEPDALARLRAVVPDFPTLDAPGPGGQAPFAATENLAYVLFTSGSTGKPKGVAMGTRPLAHLIDWHARHARLGQRARTLQFAPLSFDVHFQEIFSTLACAGTLVVIAEEQRRDPARLHAALIDKRIERIFLPYVALQMIADASRDVVPTQLRDAISAGEQLQITPAIRDLFRRLPGAELHNHYGPTESHVVTAHELRGDVASWPEIPPIGLPLPHVTLAVRNEEDGAGELLLGGETLADGYIGRADLTEERFREDLESLPGRWYVTGDLVRRDADGVCTYLGRADQQVKVDGFRIEPGEIEIAIMADGAVKDAVVAAPEIPGAGKQLVAYLVAREGAVADENLFARLRAELRGKLPEYMVPVRWVALDRLPTTPSGKIDRKALPVPQAAKIENTASPIEIVRAVWQDLMGLARIDDDQNLFDLGAKSLLVLRFVARLKDLGIAGVNVADVYDRPTVAGIAAAMGGQTRTSSSRGRRVQSQPTEGIAIVGMALRVPGSKDVETFWRNLVENREGIRHFAPHEVDTSVPESWRGRPNFVAAHGALEDVERFDAAHFGIPAREATMLDPQQRLMLELSVSALEHAAIDPARGDARIGVYAGTGNNAYAHALRAEAPELVQQYGEFATMLASEKDYVATRIANRLNLLGPALSIHTACSTSLVAIAEACRALADGQCDVAIGGAVNVHVPQAGGYLHVEGGMESADGHCRPFDADASGTVFASGGGVVVLRRLEDALAAGDTIHAVIRGVGLNNDGGDKASFTAPSVSGQAGAIRMALEQARVDPRSIGYVEAHGTATSLGDPIEIAALSRAWREDTADNQFCNIGSVKSNIGHLAAGAGVVGLIKSVLSLERELIPATLHFRRPNPQIDFASTPFKVVAQNTPWPRGTQARRAAVSSFGVGGTNAHVVIEEAPAVAAKPPDGARRFVLPLSARNADAALRRARDLADHLEQNHDLALEDVAATLMRGRKPMAQRLSVVASSLDEAIAALRSAKSASMAMAKPRVVFLFPGQGSQHPGMVRNLCDEAPAFREAFERCLAIANPALGVDLGAWLSDADAADAQVGQLLAETRYAQPALFSVSYALAAWLDSLGVRPHAMIGHSIGEYAAACHAGVFPLGDALGAVIARGQAMFEQPRGSMLAVRTHAEAVRALLPAGVEIAGVNAPSLTVVAGTHEAIDAFAKHLEANDIGTTRLRVSHAFHSASMEGALPRVAQALRGAALQAPKSVVYSCITGAPLTAVEATDPDYWARQVRSPVQFSRAVAAELALGDAVFVEVGPGQALTALLRQHRTAQNAVPRNVPLLGAANDPGDPAQQSLAALGSLWCAGVDVAWPVASTARRVPLPTYPFHGERHWFARKTPALASADSIPSSPAVQLSENVVTMSRIPNVESELKRVLGDVSGLPPEEMTNDASFVDQGLDSLSLTQATLELERVFGVKLRFRRLLEDLDTIAKLAVFLDGEMPAGKFAPAPVAPAATLAPAVASPAVQGAAQPMMIQPVAQPMAYAPAATMPMLTAGGNAVAQLIQQQMQLMSQQLSLLAGQPVSAVPSAIAAPMAAPVSQPAVAAASSTATPADAGPQPSIKSLVEKPFGASPRLTLEAKQDFTPAQRRWIDDFIAKFNARTGKSKTFSQKYRKVMADPRVVTGFNPLWKDLVYPIVVDRSKGASLWDLDGNEYIDLLSCFGGNLLGYQPEDVIAAMRQQLELGLEVGPQHPLAAEVAELITEFTGMERVGFCNTGSEAVMGAMRIARTVTGRKTIAIFTNSYHGIFDEVIVRGTKQLRSLSAAPGILANMVDHILVLDWNSEDSLRVLRERGHELAAIMTEPIQNKYPTIQPREFVRSLRQIADQAGCALIFDEVVTGFRVAPGGAQEFYGVRADIATYGKVIGGGLPFAAIAGNSKWLDALDGGHWQYGDDSYPEAGVTYFAGTFVRHPLALAAARASLLHLKRGGREFYSTLNDRTQRLIDRLNRAFAVRGAPVKAVHCASLWRLQWDDNQKHVSLFYYLARFHGLHLYEQFGHFVTEGMTDTHTDRIFDVFTNALDELMALGLLTPRDGTPPQGPGRKSESTESAPKALIKDPAELSPGQTERWLAANFDPNARRALNESLLLELEGDADLEALEASLIDVMKRHEAFRITFDTAEPLQSIAASVEPKVHRVDLSADADPQAALDKFCEESSGIIFDLDAPPLARVSVVKLGAKRAAVHLVVSHLIFDGWASPVFVQDLAVAYRARRGGSAPLWKSEAESPRQFAAAEQQRWSGAQGREAAEYWKREMQSPPAVFSLGDLTPPTPRLFRGDTLRRSIDGKLLQDLTQLSRRHKSTMFQVLLASVTEMVYRLSGREDFVISIPYASQALERHGPLIADGVLDLPVRLQRKAADGFQAVLERVKTKVMDALDQPLATQGSVARSVGVTSVGSRPPLTSVFFNMNPRLNVNGFEPLRAEIHECRKLGLLSEVVFNFYEKAGEITLDLHYSTEFYSARRAAEVTDALMATLRDAVAGTSPSTVTAAVPASAPAPAPAAKPDNTRVTTLSAADLEKLARWNATETAYETGLRLGDLIRRTVQKSPNAVAIRFEGRDVSYAELDRLAWTLARKLRDNGVVPGTLVGVCLDRSVELVVALVGVTYSGGAYVPLDPAYPKERLTNMCEDAKMSVLVTRARELAGTGTAVPASIRKILMEELPVETGSTASNELVGTPADPAYVIFTSGSTGRPKGAMNAHAGIVNRLQWMQQEYGLTPADRVMQKTPYSFDVSVWEFFWPLLTGSTIVVARPDGHKDAGYIAQLIEEEKVTVLHFVPSMLRLFLEDPRGEQCRSLRLVVCSGEALPIDAVDKFFENLPSCKLGNLYGPTEAAVDVTCWNCVPGDPRRIIPIGRPIANTRMYVLGEKLELLPPGQEGELYIGGVQVGMGYVSRPDLTSERFLPDPFIQGGRMYKTGDVGRWLDDGVIEYLGRADHQVKIRGFRIELGEIEAQLMASQLVAHCVVVARDFGGGDMRLVAYVVPRGMMPEASELKAFLGKTLPEFMVPQVYVAMGSIPLLPNGKIDRKALPAPAGPKLAAGAPNTAPRNELEQTVANAFQAVLKLASVSVHDDFFSLGGHSLLAARVIGSLNRDLKLQLSLRTVFESPTVEKLAAAIDKQRTGPAGPKRAAIVRVANQSTAPLTLMQERIRFVEEMQPGRVVYHAPSGHRLKGKMNLQAFDQAFRKMIERQPSLRTSIVATPNGFVQQIDDSLQYSLLPLEDLSTLPEERREQVLAEQIEALVAETFDLAHGPLFRARLFKMGEDHHVLFFMTHHIVWDGWSFDILYTEISALYEAALQGREPDLPPPPVTYTDFAHWHNDWLKSDEIKAQVAYWKGRFALGEMPRDPIVDLQRLPGTPSTGDNAYLHIETAQAEKVRDLAKQTGSTLSMVALSVYAAIMSQWLNDPQPTIGMPVRGRPSADLDGVMGFFNNLIAVRMPVDLNLPAVEWVKAVRKVMVEAIANQDVPFEQLASELNLSRAGAPTRLYQVMFSFQDARQRPTHWGPLEHTRVTAFQKGSTEDINLWMVEIPNGIEGGLQYNSELYLPETANALRDRFLTVLEDMARNPNRTMAQLLAARPAEQAQIGRWNDVKADGAATPDALDALAGRWTSAATLLALRDGSMRVDYAELGKRVQAFEGSLRNVIGTMPATIAIGVVDPIAQVVASLAALRAGARVIPFDPQLDDTALQALLQANGVTALVAAGAPAGAAQWIDAAGIPGVRTLAAAARHPHGVSAAQAAQVALTRADLNLMLARLSAKARLRSDDRVVCLDGPARGLQFVQAMLAFAEGSEVVFVPADTDATKLVKALRDEHAGLLHASGATWAKLLEATAGQQLPIIALVDVTDSTTALTGALIEAGATVIALHRPDTFAVPVAAGLLADARDQTLFGQPLLGGGVAVLDAKGQPVPAAIPGELHVQGAVGRIATGLLARWRQDGVLQHVGQVGTTVFIDGCRADLAALERALKSVPGVADAAVAVLEDAVTHRRLAVCVQTSGSAELAACGDVVRQVLPRGVNAAILAVDRIVRLPDGSPDPKLFEARRETVVAQSGPSLGTPTQQALAEVWEELLGVVPGPHDNFFDLGGTSLMAMNAVVKVEQRIGKQISPRRYVIETLAQLAAAYDNAGSVVEETAAAKVEPAPSGGLMRRLAKLIRRA